MANISMRQNKYCKVKLISNIYNGNICIHANEDGKGVCKLFVVIVAFMAQLSSEIKDPAIGSTIVFDNVHLNLGDAYNPANGVFVAKVAGVYVFHLTVSSKPATSNNVS